MLFAVYHKRLKSAIYLVEICRNGKNKTARVAPLAAFFLFGLVFTPFMVNFQD